MRRRPGSKLDRFHAALARARTNHVRRMARAEVLFALAERHGSRALARRAGWVGSVLARAEAVA